MGVHEDRFWGTSPSSAVVLGLGVFSAVSRSVGDSGTGSVCILLW